MTRDEARARFSDYLEDAMDTGGAGTRLQAFFGEGAGISGGTDRAGADSGPAAPPAAP